MSPRKRRSVSPHKRLLTQARPHYDWLLEREGGGCGICRRPPSANRRLDIDHDHRTMRVRGLLCHLCNRALPVHVDETWLVAALAYVRRDQVDEWPPVEFEEAA